MLDPEWSEADRLELAATLRDLRRAAGLSGQALGARVYMSQAKISRIETGRIVPSVTDVELLVYALDVDAERSRELVSMARVANTEFESGRLRDRTDPAARQWALRALEAQCRIQRHFLPTVVNRSDSASRLRPAGAELAGGTVASSRRRDRQPQDAAPGGPASAGQGVRFPAH